MTHFFHPFGPQSDPAGNPFTPVKHVFDHNINAGNFGPRFGFAFDPFKDHKTSIRGGVGIFFDPTSGRLWESNFINTAPSGFSVPTVFVTIVFPGNSRIYVDLDSQPQTRVTFLARRVSLPA